MKDEAVRDAAAEAVLDRDLAGRLSAEYGEDFMETLARAIAAEGAAALARLAAVPEAAEAERLLHALRGGALTLGLTRTEQIAGELECAARSGTAPDAPAIAELRRLWEEGLASHAAFRSESAAADGASGR